MWSSSRLPHTDGDGPSKLAVALLVVAGLAALAGLDMFVYPPAGRDPLLVAANGLGELLVACFFTMLARLAQARSHQVQLIRALRGRDAVPR